MKIRFPLYAKIPLWGLLNILFLMAVFYLFVRVQFRLGLDSLLMSRAGDRIQAVSDVIAFELSTAQPANWNDVLRRFSEAYQVQFFLFGGPGVQLAGEKISLPTNVLARLAEPPGPPPPRSRFMGPRGNNQMVPQDRPGPRDWRGFPRGRPDRPPPPAEQAIERPPPKFMLHSENPSRYWVLSRLRWPAGEEARPRGATLIAMSNSIRGGGLFFDFLPWVEVLLGVIAFSALFWFPLVRGITKSLSRLTQATERIAEGSFDVRLAEKRSDELGALSESINRMAARLVGFVTGQKRFLGDIAHELCSPLARAQMALAILDERGDLKQKAYLEDVREEIERMSELVNELLSFSKAGLKNREIELKPVVLGEVLQSVIEREIPPGTTLRNTADPTLAVQAEPDLLARAVANVLRNAIRYAGTNGPISISSQADGSEIRLTIADCGPGVPEPLLAQIFDPFFRADPSRSRESGGAGLGLAIVKTCVEACGGKVTAKNRIPSGLEVTLTLRAAPNLE